MRSSKPAVTLFCLGLLSCFIALKPASAVSPERGQVDIHDAPRETSAGGLVFPRNTPVRKGKPKQLVEERQRRSQPDEHSIYSVNPPTFRWKSGKGAKTSFEIEISRSADFRGALKSTVDSAFYRPASPLSPGKWWWRTRKSGAAWSKSTTFTLPEGLVEWPIPSWKELMSRVPDKHPRIYIRPEDVASYRKKSGTTLAPFVREWSEFLAGNKAAEKLGKKQVSQKKKLNSKVDDEEVAHRRQRWATRMEANQLAGRLPDLSWLWMMTGEERWAEEAKKIVLETLKLDAQGKTSARKMDKANSTIMHGVAIAYDMLYERFTAAERAEIRDMLVTRARPVIKKFFSTVPGKPVSSHGWDRTYLDGMIVALALYGENKEASQWLEPGLKRFVAFYPWFGGSDGGSSQGANYFISANLPASFRIRDFFHAAFGIDFSQSHPWYRNRLYYLIYSFPPGGIMATFGDLNPRRSEEVPNFRAAMMARRMADLQGNGFAAEYSEQTMTDNERGWYFELARWLPAADIKHQSLDDLPRARLFSDIGVAYLYSDITDAVSNVRFEFRSSPFGSLSHAHADQNSFNIIAGNRPLIIDSGYYNAYGTDHHKNWTRQSKAHNTILVDGIGQPSGKKDETSAYGRIAQFLDGDRFTYLLGEADTAYTPQELTRFDRHVVWLKGDARQTYVIIDDLETGNDRARKFEWLLHSGRKMQIDQKHGVVSIFNDKAQGRVTFISPNNLDFSQTNEFSVPPKKLRTSSAQLLPQWHLKAVARAKGAASFVSVIQVGGKDTDFPPISRFEGGFEVDGWRVTVKPGQVKLDPPGS